MRIVNSSRAVLFRRLFHSQNISSNPTFFTTRARIITASSTALLLTGYLSWRISNYHQIRLDSAANYQDSDPRLQTRPDEKDTVPSQSSTIAGSQLMQEKEEEAESEEGGGAFNPVTGEINWDCPCLGGMAHGPCGLQFREAFSCFVYSEEEPKGINCVEKFKAMQDCFREHPDIYGEEIMDDEENEEDDLDLDRIEPAESEKQ